MPIPFDAPVTTATLPFKSLMELLAKKSGGQPRRWSRKPPTTDNSHVGRLQLARPKESLLHLTLGKANRVDPLLDAGALMLNTIEADAAIENCRALINQIDAGLSGEGIFGNISSGAELLLLELHLERAASALEKSLSRP
jgi:hypothetical protein